MIDCKQCMGCKACVYICPKQCIKIGINERGFEELQINSSECIECGLCEKICQIENPIILKKIKNLYIINQKNWRNSIKSTSAGIANSIAEKFVTGGGVVAGVKWNNKNAVYELAETIKEVNEFRGSKYVYPDINDVYKKVKKLSKNRKVLFIGLPCHVAALYKYIDKNSENIFTIDLICHGAPQSNFLTDHLTAVGLTNNIQYLSFRDKEKYRIFAKTEKKEYTAKHYEDYYLYGFLNGLIQKEYCYNCMYAYNKRVGDITLGDSWNQSIVKTDKVNLVAINSDKGAMLLNCIEKDICIHNYDLEKFEKYDSQLKYPTKKHRNRKIFESNLSKVGFERASRRALCNEMTVLKIKKLGSKIKKLYK